MNPIPRLGPICGRNLLRGAALCAGILLGGCLSRPSLVPQSFVFKTPRASLEAGRTNSPVLVLRRLRVAAPFDGQAFVYRTGDFSYEHDPYVSFLVPPAKSLTGPIRGYLEQSGAFRQVIQPGSALHPDVALEVFVNRLYGDLRSKSRPAAVIGMQFVFYRVQNGRTGSILLRKSYLQRISIKARTAAAVMAGWNKGLQQIMSHVMADWKEAAKHR